MEDHQYSIVQRDLPKILEAMARGVGGFVIDVTACRNYTMSNHDSIISMLA
jgi:hypothetical protein